MNIVSTQYNLYNEAYEIIHSGCDGACGDECHNKDVWNFKLGLHWKFKRSEFIEHIGTNSEMIKQIWLYGGEPLLQDMNELENLLLFLKRFNKEIVLFTRFEIEEVPDMIKDLCDYIKTGFYDINNKGIVEYYGIELSTTNQKVLKKNIDY